MQAMQTLKTDPTPAVNADGELLDVVQIGYSANSGGVTITIASLVKVVDVHPRSADSPYDWWRARRDLFTISTDLTSGTETDDIWFSRNLEHDLYVFRVTPRIERLVRAAVAEGLHIVNAVDSALDPEPPAPKDADEHRDLQYRRHAGLFYFRRRFPFRLR